MRTCEIVRDGEGRGGEIVPNLLSKYYETRGKCVRRVNKRNYWEMTIDWAGHPLYHTVHNPPATSAQLTFIPRSSRLSLISQGHKAIYFVCDFNLFLPKNRNLFRSEERRQCQSHISNLIVTFSTCWQPWGKWERERDLNEILRHLPLALAGFQPSRRGTSFSRRSVRKLSV